MIGHAFAILAYVACGYIAGAVTWPHVWRWFWGD